MENINKQKLITITILNFLLCNKIDEINEINIKEFKDLKKHSNDYKKISESILTNICGNMDVREMDYFTQVVEFIDMQLNNINIETKL